MNEDQQSRSSNEWLDRKVSDKQVNNHSQHCYVNSLNSINGINWSGLLLDFDKICKNGSNICKWSLNTFLYS